MQVLSHGVTKLSRGENHVLSIQSFQSYQFIGLLSKQFQFQPFIKDDSKVKIDLQ